MKTPDQWAGALKAAGLKPSYNRICVLRFLHEHPTHPHAEDIYADLHPVLPSLSRTTVYNTLRALAEKGLVRDVRIEEGRLRYDADVSEHGHFICDGCGAIYDLPLRGVPWPDPPGARVTQRDLFERGLCAPCLASRD